MVGILLGLMLSATSVFLVLLVLLQRGRGGGLTGALGGMGGSSAFGAKAGDIFTRITIVVASIWILLCIVSLKYMGGTDPFDVETTAAPASDEPRMAPALEKRPAPGAEAPAKSATE